MHHARPPMVLHFKFGPNWWSHFQIIVENVEIQRILGRKTHGGTLSAFQPETALVMQHARPPMVLHVKFNQNCCSRFWVIVENVEKQWIFDRKSHGGVLTEIQAQIALVVHHHGPLMVLHVKFYQNCCSRFWVTVRNGTRRTAKSDSNSPLGSRPKGLKIRQTYSFCFGRENLSKNIIFNIFYKYVLKLN